MCVMRLLFCALYDMRVRCVAVHSKAFPPSACGRLDNAIQLLVTSHSFPAFIRAFTLRSSIVMQTPTQDSPEPRHASQ